MRQNLPITQTERTFPAEQRLISSTDLHGKILHCNDAFVAISGFTRDELMGQPHNIVRHPDMPPEAYTVMWGHLKAGKPWMGLVKNRCKNGDFYWVNAYVTPITEAGKVVGYESVRTCPAREDVDRAAQVYAQLRSGRKVLRGWRIEPEYLGVGAGLLGALGLYASGQVLASELLLSGTVVGFAIASAWRQRSMMHSLNALMGDAFQHELAVQTYTRDKGALGRLKVAILSRQAHLNAVLTRIEDAASGVNRESDKAAHLTEDANEDMRSQQGETQQVAAAVHQMSTTINDVSHQVQLTAQRAEESTALAARGRDIAVVTRQSIETLKESVDDIGRSVGELSEQTGRIAQAAQMIEQIADQTNLLALNAAIEAARAGEHGRGFAVVADEVRGLAKRTQDSTHEIHEIVQSLTQRATQAVRVAETGKRNAEAGVENVLEEEAMLQQVADTLSSIADMAMQMSAAVEQQAQVSDEISRQVSNISSLASHNLDKADAASKSLQGLQAIASQLHELVVRFRS
ncbi:MAG: methyl-accepting chemotaxis protein [Gammaproteobacteria bacterium]|nr:methyl-accepting chemotaxis protein [Gammaproteobacteria bacterium]